MGIKNFFYVLQGIVMIITSLGTTALRHVSLLPQSRIHLPTSSPGSSLPLVQGKPNIWSNVFDSNVISSESLSDHHIETTFSSLFHTQLHSLNIYSHFFFFLYLQPTDLISSLTVYKHHRGRGCFLFISVFPVTGT